MVSSVFLLSTIGGFTSFAATAVGAGLSYFSLKPPKGFARVKFSIDFALGLMLSAVAFSLVGPAAAVSKWSAVGFLIGALAIYLVKFVMDQGERSSSQALLVVALLLHNFPEGLASGAALAGLSSHASLPILTSIGLQNIPEGMLMVVALKALGWSHKTAFFGGLVSGLIELAGGMFAGLALSWTADVLPTLLMLAGGAMFTSVALELKEMRRIPKPEFALGLLAIPFLNLVLG